MRGILQMIDIELPTDTLKNLSLDSGSGTRQFMTNSQIRAIDFDAVKINYIKFFNGTEDITCSVDGIIDNENNKLFIEFKNGKIDTKQKKGIKSKAKDSLLIYGDIKDRTLEYFRDNYTFILVYNGEKNRTHSQSMDNIHTTLYSRANEKEVRFGLDSLYKVFFKNVCTYNESEFEKFLKTI